MALRCSLPLTLTLTLTLTLKFDLLGLEVFGHSCELFSCDHRQLHLDRLGDLVRVRVGVRVGVRVRVRVRVEVKA